MLSVKLLARLHESTRGNHTLVVYCSAPETDPALQTAWLVRAQNAVRKERERLAKLDIPLEPFDAAWKNVEAELPRVNGALGSLGWVAFANADRVLHSTPLPMAPGTLVSWSEGPRVAPYLSAIAHDRALLLVLADIRRARLFQVSGGRATEIEDLISDHAVSEGAGPGMMKGPTATSGVRGETRRDAANRATHIATERFVRSLAHAIEERADDDMTIVLGGNERVLAAVLDSLPERAANRVTIRSDLHVTLPNSEIDEVVPGLVADAAAAFDEAVMEAWSESDRAKGLAIGGWNDTVRALDEGAVDTLLLSSRFVEDQTEDAEQLIGKALERGGGVHVLAADAGEAFDGAARGVGARLRYAPSMEAPVGSPPA